ncbi:hypothetical protein GGI20_005359 [Coemansia sp. BCRC 34301]|nr:hypothetical protein GGI20_005359 [Coemansia sp. BCRC 34301]
MSTIPTLIVAPAILAAGIAYKYAGGGEGSADSRNGGQANTVHRRRRSEMDNIGEGVSSAQIAGERRSSLGARFEQDFQPRVPSQRQLADASFIPTTMLRGTTLQAQAAGISGEAPNEQKSSSLDSRKELYGMSGGPAELAPDSAGRYPRTTDEIEHTSWLQRAARSITGDLGPIEHQEAVISVQRAAEEKQPVAGSREGAPHGFVRDSAKDIRDRSVHDAARAAEDVAARMPPGDDANKAAQDATRSGADDARQTAKHAADEMRGWLWSKRKDVDDAVAQAESDVDRMAHNIADSTNQALDETQGWFWSKKKEADDAAAKAAEDVDRMTSNVSDATNKAADKAHGWFSSMKKDADDAAAKAAEDVDRMARDISDSTKQAFDETQGWFWSKKKEAGDAAQGVADNARNKLASAKEEAGEATQNIKRQASDASDSMWSWLWSKKKEVDDTATSALNTAKGQAESARDSVAEKSQQAKDAVTGAAETADDWLKEKQARAKDAARQSATDARSWAEDTKDDIANSFGRADDVTRAWAWDKKGQVDQAIADAAGAVQQSAEDASNRALESADAASRSYWQRGLGTGTTAGWRRPSVSDSSSKEQRRDSLLSATDDNSVVHALDEKFNEARSILRSTTDEIKTMASDAGNAATETLRSAAEKTLPHPSDDGINTRETYDHQAQFVESNSHIPLLSSSPHRRT